jgi:hypothetical protein
VKNGFVVMATAGPGERFVLMLADFAAAINARPPAQEE